jgi:transposase
MTRGVPISNDLRKAVLHMAKDHSKKEIWESTGVKLRSVERIVSEVERGALRVPKERAPAPPRVLSDECVQVSSFYSICYQSG